MDVVDYSEDKYNEVKKDVSTLIKSIDFKPDQVLIHPNVCI